MSIPSPEEIKIAVQLLKRFYRAARIEADSHSLMVDACREQKVGTQPRDYTEADAYANVASHLESLI